MGQIPFKKQPKTPPRELVREWLQNCFNRKNQFLIVAKDDMTKDFYPVYCRLPKDCTEALESYSGRNNPDTACEVYDLSKPVSEQAERPGAWNPPS